MERAEETKGSTWLQRRKVARKNHKRKRQRRTGPDEGEKERNIRSEITQGVVAGIKREASEQDANPCAQRTDGQRFMQSWDSSKIENEEEEESWQEVDQMAAQSDK